MVGDCMSDATDLLTQLFAAAPAALAEVRLFTPRVVRLWGPTTDLGDVDRVIAQVDGRAPIYHSLCPKTSKGSTEAHAVGFVALALDHDDPALGLEAHAVLRDVGLAPSAIVRSGRGYHAYIFLDRVYSVSDAKPIAKRLQAWLHQLGDARGLNRYDYVPGRMSPRCVASLGGDRIYDAARVLRTPGSWNSKSQSLCEVVAMTGQRYSLEYIVGVLDREGAPVVTACSPPAASSPAQRRRDRSVPLDFSSLDESRLETLWHRLTPLEQSLAQTPELSERHLRDYRVACALARAGASEPEIVWFAQACEGLRQKFSESGGPTYWSSTAEHAVNAARGLRRVEPMPWQTQEVATFGDVEVRAATVRRVSSPNGGRILVDLELDGLEGDARWFKAGCERDFYNAVVAPIIGTDFKAARGRGLTVSMRVTPTEWADQRDVLGWYR